MRYVANKEEENKENQKIVKRFTNVIKNILKENGTNRDFKCMYSKNTKPIGNF